VSIGSEVGLRGSGLTRFEISLKLRTRSLLIKHLLVVGLSGVGVNQSWPCSTLQLSMEGEGFGLSTVHNA